MYNGIGCCAIVYKEFPFNFFTHNDKILVIECKKGRGIILPGGKFEVKDKTFDITASRELEEETGVIGYKPKLFKHFMSPDGYYQYNFIFGVYDVQNMKETKEGNPFWIKI